MTSFFASIFHVFKIIYRYFEEYPSISLFSSIKLNKRASKNGNPSICYRGTKVDLSGSSLIISNGGKIIINRKWSKKDSFNSLLFMGNNSKLLVGGANDFSFYSNSKIYINNDATLCLGCGYINHDLSISCFNKITIGEGVCISEGVTIRDSDNHSIDNASKTKTAPIYIGNHVWIGMNVTILKGVNIGDGSVIAAGAVVINDIPKNCLAGGVPARVLKENITWQ